jgi:carbamate kinase
LDRKRELLVIALGGNALLDSKSKGTIEEKEKATDLTAQQLLPVLKSDFDIIITHGNGPQVGNLLIQNEEASEKIPPMPLDVCVAETQGEIGYILQKSIINVLSKNNTRKNVIALLTNVVVDNNDPAFEIPSKPVGPYYDIVHAKHLISSKGWKFKEDPAGKGYRRVVPSPKPIKILETKIINELLQDDNVIISVGGGGIPVYIDENNLVHGVEAVIDKDSASSQLAIDLKADKLIILTNVEYCYLNYNKENELKIKEMNLDEAQTYLDQGHFSSGSMGPKVSAAVDFVLNTGKTAIISNLENLAKAVDGLSGTKIHQ